MKLRKARRRLDIRIQDFEAMKIPDKFKDGYHRPGSMNGRK